jgi:protein-L-isoaspartate(D-aspartate) O-methyltransferase
VEIVPQFSHRAAAKLAAQGITNVTFEIGDAARGWDKHAPYDAIAVTGSLPLLPPSFQRMLAPRGRLVAVVGDAPAMQVTLATRLSAGAYRMTRLFETCIAPLKNALEPERFAF